MHLSSKSSLSLLIKEQGPFHKFQFMDIKDHFQDLKWPWIFICDGIPIICSATADIWREQKCKQQSAGISVCTMQTLGTFCHTTFVIASTCFTRKNLLLWQSYVMIHAGSHCQDFRKYFSATFIKMFENAYQKIRNLEIEDEVTHWKSRIGPPLPKPRPFRVDSWIQI